MFLNLKHFGGKWGMLELWDGDYNDWQVSQLFICTYTNQTTSWLMHNWNTFGAWTSHGHTWTHKIHHDLDLGEATTFPLIVLFVIGHGSYTQISFFSRLPNQESQNFRNWDSQHFGSPQLILKTSDWNKVECKVVTFVESFPMICDMPPAHT
jgi:hypothetical protein